MRELSAKQKIACALLGRGLSQAAVAEQMTREGHDISARSIWGWLHDSNGIGRAMASEIARHAEQFAAELVGKCLGQLSTIVESGEEPNRVQAARAVFDLRKTASKRQSDLAKLEIERERLALERERFAVGQVGDGEGDGVTIIEGDE